MTLTSLDDSRGSGQTVREDISKILTYQRRCIVAMTFSRLQSLGWSTWWTTRPIGENDRPAPLVATKTSSTLPLPRGCFILIVTLAELRPPTGDQLFVMIC
jgi:uncharacterized iron-regulated membrane protein